MKSKTASLIINPRTGENVAKLQDVLAVLAAAGWKTEIALKEYARHTMQLANQATIEKKDLVIAYGGDGTLNQVVNGVMNNKRHSIVGLVPGGTANVWAGEIGIPHDPVKAALTLVNSEERKVDIGRVTVQSCKFPGEAPVHVENGRKKMLKASKNTRHHFLLMAGLGIDAAIMENVSKPLKYRIGPLAVGLSAAKELPAQHPFPIEIHASGASPDDEPIWKGEALQVVIGNTRRYAKVAEMTPDAHIDDGVLDVCVITAGDPLTTMEQLSSLLLRRKPDKTTAEYFHGAHLRITVPATVPLQLDGSAVKLKDYLPSAIYKQLQKFGRQDQVMVSYAFDALPQALQVAIPRTYNDELFEHVEKKDLPLEAGRPEQKEEHNLHPIDSHHHHEENSETAPQQHTVAVEAKPASHLHETEDEHKKHQHEEEIHKELPNFVESLVKNGQKVTVIGKVPNPARAHTYIIAGTMHKPGTGESKPAAVVVDDKTAVLDHEGKPVADIAMAIQDLEAESLIVVEGKRSKRNVLQARRIIL